jgi:hypothetical protein
VQTTNSIPVFYSAAPGRVSECDLAQSVAVGLFVTQLIALTLWIRWGTLVQPSAFIEA